MIIGLTGGIGTGKSTVSRKLRERGYPVIDLDVISREVIEYPEVINELVRNFGIEILESQNNISGKKSISRNKLRQTVFKEEKKVSVLNSIMHPPIVEEMRRQVENFKKNYKTVFVEVQLLFEAKLEKEFDLTVLVYADKKTQLERVLKRDGRKEEEVQQIINAQMDMTEKRRLSNYIIENNGDSEMLDLEIEKFIKKLKI
ncbi:dephospho-CoA kinase [Leptotrichia sp. oral taxon 212]|jgi:dephospho-coA kinase|uniref:dephospho-CoA kinase n=1 Tax=Leptotrichia sp. oral taxon 212 TaxID=712357 RepID=UPI0006A9D869|nr:dephospho-CoA kinase [Leptotrichia sp. oral taxon 212]ALA96108.1 dephospho-CoA kinase [Leptotrichia sp. oral taxon 212]